MTVGTDRPVSGPAYRGFRASHSLPTLYVSRVSTLNPRQSAAESTVERYP